MEKYGGFWLRVAAFIDTVLFEIVQAPFILLAYGPSYYDWSEAPAKFVRGPVDVLVTWVLPFVLTILFWRYKRATPGKMLLKMEVVDADTGETLTWGQCILRYIGYILAALPCGIGLFMIAFDPQKRGLHDRFANTVVRRL